MSAHPDVDTDAPVVAAVIIYANADGSFVPVVETDLSGEVFEGILRQTADVVSGKDDRASGAWGR